MITWTVDTTCPDCDEAALCDVTTGDPATDPMVDVRCPECGCEFACDLPGDGA